MGRGRPSTRCFRLYPMRKLGNDFAGRVLALWRPRSIIEASCEGGSKQDARSRTRLASIEDWSRVLLSNCKAMVEPRDCDIRMIEGKKGS